jgi:vanillate O-demethylase ferredoxin subunit
MNPIMQARSTDMAYGGSVLSNGGLELVVTEIGEAARDTKVYEFSSTAIPFPYEAGAHIDLRLPNGLIRSYSLISPRVPATSASSAYAIAVKRDPKSRGGSRFMHDELSVGSRIRASRPRNNFPLI